ncbi:MAG: hypothetical protein FJW37_07505 [Acidobacteria bacterium]|nr:hypothetical protein [Acidobacteriota bacterium]
MANDGSLVLNVLDVFGKPVGETIDIILTNQTLSEKVRVDDVRASGPIRVTGLRSDTHNLYALEVWAPSYHPVARFVNVTAGREITFTLPVNPRKVVRLDFPPFDGLPAAARALLSASRSVLGAEGKTGAELYAAVPDLSRAGLLNICAKCSRTRLSSGDSVLSQIGELLELRGDRFFARVPKTLREETKNSAMAGLFDEVSGALHRPPAGYQPAGSWKTPDSVANLQLTFFTDGADWRADIDIDDHNGFAHVFQVIQNTFTGGTHPYNIHQALIASQEIDPGYRLVLTSAVGAHA